MQQREVDTDHQIATVVRRVQTALSNSVPEAELDAEVRRCFTEWDDAPVRGFIPIFAERRLLERLR